MRRSCHSRLVPRDGSIETQAQAFFGHYLRELEPYNTTIRPRGGLIKTFNRYLDSPRARRSGDVPSVSEVEDEERQARLSHDDSARILLVT